MTGERWIRVLLRLYPRAFRTRFGSDMRATFNSGYRARTTQRERAAFLAGALIDAVKSASGEWTDTIRELRPPSRMFADLQYALRHAARSLARNPGFATATVLTLAVGIGATTAVFSVMGTALLTPLPYPNASRLVAIAETRRGDEISLSYPDLLDFQTRSQSFESVAGFTGLSFALTGGDEPERLRGQIVTANLFPTLGVQPILGHSFAASDDAPNAPPVVAISHALWARRFGSDSTIIGRAIILNGVPFTVTAVLPPLFRFPDGMTYGPSDVWVPMSQLGMNDRETRDSHPGIAGVAVMRPGVTLAQARRDLSGVAAALVTEYPASNKDTGVLVRDAVDAIVGSLSSTLVLMFGAAIVVLLIACANVAGLLLTRADSRRREMSIKVALGADGIRVAANFAAEAMILAVLGGIAGTALAYGLVTWFGFAVADLPRLAELSLDIRALAFALLATITVAVACSLAPLLWARATNSQSALQSRGAGKSGASRLRDAFVVAQVAMSLMLIVAASLLLRTFESMTSNTGGIRPDGVVTFIAQLPQARYGAWVSRTNFATALTERLAAQPGVTKAALVSVLPFSGAGSQSGIAPFGGTRDDEKRTDVASVTPDYFQVMGVDLVRGRVFTASDDSASLPVVVVDERFADAMWPSDEAIGKRVSGWGNDWTVVGVVRHVKNYGVSAESRQEMYAPFAQRPSYRVTAVVKTTAEATTALTAARAAVREIDPLLPVYGAQTMRTIVDATVAGPRLAAFMSAGYALTALLVVIIGIHGAIAYLVVRRTREIGVRVALGASRQGVIRLVVNHSLRLTGLGVLIGVAGGIALTRLIREQLFSVSPLDIPTFAGAAIAMMLAGVVASALPAWRALKVSPLLALSDE